MGIYILFIVFFIFAIATENSNQSTKNNLLIFSVLVLSWIAATRDIHFWPDSLIYNSCFIESPTFSDYSFGMKPSGYNDKGYHFLQVLIRTITSDSTIYFFIIAAIGLSFICRGLRKYAIFPLFGLAIYISRFYFGRQLIQIRAGISIGIVFWAMQYVTDRKLVKYTIAIFIASLFHFSAPGYPTLPISWV